MRYAKIVFYLIAAVCLIITGHAASEIIYPVDWLLGAVVALSITANVLDLLARATKALVERNDP